MPPRKGRGVMINKGTSCSFSKPSAHRPMMKPNRLKVTAVSTREVDAEGGVGDALRQERKHDQPRHDERAVSDAVHSSDARPDRRPEDHKVERGREHRGHDALQQRPPRAGHFEQVDGPDRQNVHARTLSSPTKISSSELWLVCRSLNRMPAWARSARSAVMPVRSAWVS